MGTAKVVDREVAAFDPFTAEALECPHAGWAKLRRDAPIYPISIPGISTPVFMVTRKQDIEEIARQPMLFSNHPVPSIWRWGEFEPDIANAFAKCGRKVAFTLATSDPPEASEYRRVVDKYLGRRSVDGMQSEIEAIVDRLMSAIPSETPFNFVEAFSVPLPLLVICLILGIPYEDADFIRKFSDEFTHLVDPAYPVARAVEAADTVADGYSFFERYVLQYRQAPAANLLSEIANASIHGRPITIEEALSMAHNLSIAGNETTRNALSSAMLRLARDPSLWDLLRKSPERVPDFVEELLRIDAPATTTARQVMSDTEIGGVRIPKGSCLFLMWASAGADEAVFRDPHQFDVDRMNKRAHLTFGSGLHNCAGRLLARAEILTSVRRWLKDFSNIELAVSAGEIRYEPSFGFRALGKLPLRVTRVSRE